MSIIAIEPFYIISINGVPLNSTIFTSKIEIEMNCSFDPDFFNIQIYNLDSLTQLIITKGSIISISLGYKTLPPINIITGVITYINNFNEDQDSITEIRGIDYVIYQLKKKYINLSITIPIDVIDIIKQIALQSAVILSSFSISSGIILSNYTVNNESAYSAIARLVKRINFNVTSKLSQLYITRTIISPIQAIPINDASGFTFFKSSGLNQNSNNQVNGYSFIGNGDSTLIPMKILTVTLTKQLIFGTYVIESVKHVYDENGYTCSGNVIEINQDFDVINIISKSSKTIANIINKKIDSSIKNQSTIDTGVVEQLLTSKIGINKDSNQSIINKSIESEIGYNNVYVNKKPIMSSFVGNGFGIINPIYQNNRCILGFNRFDKQDINILGFLWDKNWTIPDHDLGDWMLHHKNHSKIRMKEDGHGNIQLKGLKIEIGSNGLVASKPTKTDDGKFVLVFDDNSELSYKSGDGWKLKTTGNVEIDGTAIKIGSGATLGAARLNDPVLLDASLLTWLNTHTHPTAAIGPPSPPLVPHTGTDSGTIKTASTKVKIE